MSSGLLRVFCSILLLGMSDLCVAQTIINVPGSAATIQAAITLAQNGDTVLVAPGTYNFSNMAFLGKAITVKSSGGATVTTIDAGFANRHFTFASGEGPNTVLEGFRLLNGESLNGSDGGSVRISNSSPTIRACVFDTCRAGSGGVSSAPVGLAGNGGAVSIAGSSNPTLIDCRFLNCKSGNGSYSGSSTIVPGYGGAIYATAPFTMIGGEISGCRTGGYVTLNPNFVTLLGGLGGAVYATAAATFDGVTFSGNHTFSNLGPGGAIAATGPVTIDRCAFQGNFTADGGISFMTGFVGNSGNGGACYFFGSTATIRRSRFLGNFTGSSWAISGSGGAVSSQSGSLLIEDCEFADNFAGTTSGFYANNLNGAAGAGGAVAASSATTIRRTRFSRNAAGHVFGPVGTPGNGGAVLGSGPLTIENSFFDRNIAGDSDAVVAGRGGGVAKSGAVATIVACTFTGNRSGSAQNVPDIYDAISGGANVSRSIVWQNGVTPLAPTVTMNESNCDVPHPGTGNISADPKFVAVSSGNLRLAWDSPCIDFGSPLPPTVQAFDVDGEPRLSGNAVDLGADEVLRAGTADDFETTSLGASWSSPHNATKSPQTGESFVITVRSPEHALDGEVVIVAVEGFAVNLPPIGPPSLPFVAVNPGSPSGFLIIEPSLPAAGLVYSFAVPSGLGGTAARVQAFILTPSASNGFLAATAAHDIVWP